ncbi:MAG: hypothetical protein O2954_13680 [bacterium]|nr:hypothetical protein [bacterium]
MKTLRPSSWSTLGWHGISLNIPADWNPGKIVGDEKAGEMRLDAPTTIRLELEWKEARGEERVGLIVDRYVESLAKNAQKEKKALEVERTPANEWLNLPDMRSVEYFTWKTDSQVHTLACYSPSSDRLIFLRVMEGLEEDLSTLLPTIFNSLSDTPPDQPRTWALYDLECLAPPDYNLENYQLKSGHIRLVFEKGRNRLQVDRLSLAKTLLKNQSIEDWYLDFFRKDLRSFNTSTQENAMEPHPGLTIQGKPKSRWRALLMPLPFWNVRPRMYLDGHAWACPDSNKIYSVQSHWKKAADAPDIEQFLLGVRCHTKQDHPKETKT